MACLLEIMLPRIERNTFLQFVEDYYHNYGDCGEPGAVFLDRFFPGLNDPDIIIDDEMTIWEIIDARYVQQLN